MGYNIAVAGKGGTGKTSLTGLLVNNLTTNNKGPVLVVEIGRASCRERV